MRRLLLMVMLTALLIPLLPTLVAAGGGSAGLTSRVTIQLDGQSAPDALQEVFRDRPESYVFRGEPIDEQAQRLFLTLNNVEFESAVRVICDAAELDCEFTDGIWVIWPHPAAAYLHGARVPVLGSVQVSRGGGTGAGGEADVEAARVAAEEILSGMRVSTSSRINGQSARYSPQLPPGLGNIIIDLEVTEATLEEVAARLSEIEGVDVEVRIHPAVAPTFRVTASVYRMPFSQVLSLLMDRAGLTCSVERIQNVIPEGGSDSRDAQEPASRGGGNPPMAMGHWDRYVAWIVPTPTLSIIGRPDAGGYGSGYGPMADPNRPAETPGAPGS